MTRQDLIDCPDLLEIGLYAAIDPRMVARMLGVEEYSEEEDEDLAAMRHTRIAA